MHTGLPEFFIKLLTKPGDLVLDPFAGSNTTGASAEIKLFAAAMGRRRKPKRDYVQAIIRRSIHRGVKKK